MRRTARKKHDDSRVRSVAGGARRPGSGVARLRHDTSVAHSAAM
jgi:hypothetical protein